MQTEAPNFIASESILWIRPDGTETLIEAKIGEPYQIDEHRWACPALLSGIDGRYPDIVCGTSLQALSLAIHFLITRLGHMLEDKARLVYPEDRTEWDLSTFGKA